MAAVLLTAGLLPTGSFAIPVAAATTTIHLRVESARAWAPSGLADGQAIPGYHWLIVKDDTGDPTHYSGSDTDCKPQSLGGDPAYPANCQWPSIHSVPGGTAAEAFAQGDQADLNDSDGLTLPNGKYMISVTADPFDIPGCTSTPTVTCHADGFKIDGSWFSVPSTAPNGLVTVAMQPYPLPLLTLRMAVWNDLQTNGAYDTGEPNLAGFEGHINDVLGPVTTDWYGNPICTVYAHDTDGLMIFGDSLTTGSLTRVNSSTLRDTTNPGWTANEWAGKLVYIAGGSQAGRVFTISASDNRNLTVTPNVPNLGGGSGGQPYVVFELGDAPLVQTIGGHCLSDADGVISIPYLGPDRYASTVVPPDGQEWYQTTHPRGLARLGHLVDRGLERLRPGVRPGSPSPSRSPSSASSSAAATRRPPADEHARRPRPARSRAPSSASASSPQLLAGYTIGGGQGKHIIETINRPLVSLIDTRNDDTTVYVGRGDADGTFQINDVPDGDYVLSFWDEDQAYLLTEVDRQRPQRPDDRPGRPRRRRPGRAGPRQVCNDTNRNGKCEQRRARPRRPRPEPARAATTRSRSTATTPPRPTATATTTSRGPIRSASGSSPRATGSSSTPSA